MIIMKKKKNIENRLLGDMKNFSSFFLFNTRKKNLNKIRPPKRDDPWGW